VDSLPAQLGATIRVDGDDLLLEVEPRPALLHHGMIRASVLAYLIDCAGGIPLDRDPDAWTLTTDLTVKALPLSAPERVTAQFRVLRAGRRSATGIVDLHSQAGIPVATGAIGFTRVPVSPGDPPKPYLSAMDIVDRFASLPAVEVPLREAAGIEIIDATAGVVEVPLTSALLNPAGTVQGAMAALIAEAAAEDVLTHRAGQDMVVTDLDIRYLDRTSAGPLRTSTEVLGDGPDASVTVELSDCSSGKITTLFHARGVPASKVGDRI